MQTLNQYYNQLYKSRFIQILIYNVVTIAAIIVGIFKFSVRAWNENDCEQKVKEVINTVLQVIANVTSRLYTFLNQDSK